MTTQLSTTNNNADLQAMLKQGSGEAEQKKYVKFPIITIDNSMVDAEITDSKGVKRMTKVRCEPQFIETEKLDNEYKSSPFAPDFEAVILKHTHQVRRKLLMDQKGNITNKLPFFKSLEFASFSNDVYIWQDGKFLSPMDYKTYKLWAGEEGELWSCVYFVIPGEDFVRKAEFKGASRGVVFDYMTASRSESVSSFVTKFSGVVADDAAQPYNKLLLERTEKNVEDLMDIITKQKQLNSLLSDNMQPHVKVERVENANVLTAGGVVVQEGEIDFSEKVDKITETNGTAFN